MERPQKKHRGKGEVRGERGSLSQGDLGACGLLPIGPNAAKEFRTEEKGGHE